MAVVRKKQTIKESHDFSLEEILSKVKRGELTEREAKHLIHKMDTANIDEIDYTDVELDEADIASLKEPTGGTQYAGKQMGEEGEDVIAAELDSLDLGEVGEVEVEKVLDPETLPIQHADEEITLLDVFVVSNPEFANQEFYAVVDHDGDADDGITFAVLSESMEEVDQDATQELVNSIVAKLEQIDDVINLNDVDGLPTEIIDDEPIGEADDDELEINFGMSELPAPNEEGLNEPFEGGFEVVANEDGTISVLGDVATLLDVAFGDAAEDVEAELSELPIEDEVVEVVESLCSFMRTTKRFREANVEVI